jgi:hypothetical protein
MTETKVIIVAPEMVWLYYFERGTKHVKELLGKEAIRFIESQPVKVEAVQEPKLQE